MQRELHVREKLFRQNLKDETFKKGILKLHRLRIPDRDHISGKRDVTFCFNEINERKKLHKIVRDEVNANKGLKWR
jgi:hypothetical protein